MLTFTDIHLIFKIILATTKMFMKTNFTPFN